MGQREDGGERAVRRVRFPVDPDFAEKDRLTTSRADGERLRHRQIAGVDQVLDLEVHLEFIGNPKCVAGGGQRIEGLEEDEEQERGPAMRTHFGASIHTCSAWGVRNRIIAARC